MLPPHYIARLAITGIDANGAMMTKQAFFDVIYNKLRPGMNILVPKRVSAIEQISETGDIIYCLNRSYRKSLSRDELSRVYDELESGDLTTNKLRKIVTTSRPCNVSTIKWILRKFELATETDRNVWHKNW